MGGRCGGRSKRLGRCVRAVQEDDVGEQWGVVGWGMVEWERARCGVGGGALSFSAPACSHASGAGVALVPAARHERAQLGRAAAVTLDSVAPAGYDRDGSEARMRQSVKAPS